MDTTPKICIRFGCHEMPISSFRKGMEQYSNFDILPNHPYPLEGIIDNYDLIIFVVDKSFKNSFGHELVSSKIGEHIVENNKRCVIMKYNSQEQIAFDKLNFDDYVIEIPYRHYGVPREFAQIVERVCHRIEIKKATEYFSKK